MHATRTMRLALGPLVLLLRLALSLVLGSPRTTSTTKVPRLVEVAV